MKAARGFALASGIFLLVILALLGAFMLSVSSSQHVASALDVQGTRGYRAARLGLEWAAATICHDAGCANPLTACPASPTTLDTNPDGFSVVVTCTMRTYQEAGAAGNVPRYVFLISATATAGGNPGDLAYVERNVSSFLEFPN